MKFLLQTNRTAHSHILALCAICLITVFGVLLGVLLPDTYTVPIFAISMLVWIITAKLFSGWGAVITGLTALVAAFAGTIGAYWPAALVAILAAITLIRPEPRKTHTDA
jgi:asparagine N-glycosylation enzyme membrane subunit Stt3